MKLLKEIAVAACVLMMTTYASSAGTLTAWTGSADPVVDITAEGSKDWVVWSGTSGNLTTYRKALTTRLIDSIVISGSSIAENHQAYNFKFTWTDGEVPNATAPAGNAPAVTLNRGMYSFQVPADQTVRTVKFYVCGSNQACIVTATLSDGSAPVYSDASYLSDGGYEGVYTLTYSANSANQRLKVEVDGYSWMISDWPKIRLHAVTLREGAATHPSTVPATPVLSKAYPGNGVVTLVWPRISGIHSYNVYRSSTGTTGTTPVKAGVIAPWSTIAPPANNVVSEYGDYDVTNGATYTYQITAVNGGLESPKSNSVTANPLAMTHAITKGRFLKILPFGNSITEGCCEGSGGWRQTLQDSLTKAGYTYALVGSHTTYSSGMTDPYHEGWGGRKIANVHFGVMERALTNYDPDIVIMEIGTNDLAWIPADDGAVVIALRDYDTLLADIFRIKPLVTLVAAGILPLSGKDKQVRDLNAGIKAKITALAQKGKQAYYVDEMDGITLTQVPGIHPPPAIYKLMGGIYYRAIKAITTTTSTAPSPRAAGTHLRVTSLLKDPRVKVYGIDGRLIDGVNPRNSRDAARGVVFVRGVNGKVVRSLQ